MRDSEPDGVLLSQEGRFLPDDDGVLLRRRLLLPDFERACYYAPFQKYAIDPALDLWPEGYNQCHPLVVDDLRFAKRGGLFLVLQLQDGTYLSLLPAVSEASMAWFRGDEEGLWLEAGHWGTGSWTGQLPLLIWARSANLYESCERAWRLALAHPALGSTARLRREKEFPEMFRYLGWCSWEEFKWNITGESLARIIRDLDASPAPVRWVLIDDGHIDEGTATPVPNGQNGETPVHESDRRLVSFGLNALRFPDGWKPVAEAREESRLRWLGVWLNFNGYWGGVHPQNHLGALNDFLVETKPGALQPDADAQAADAFYDALVASQEEAGFDFIKVDNQAKNITFYRGNLSNAVQATMTNHRALETAVHRRMDAMINCMAHNNLCAFSTRHSQITRCSEDYKKGDLWRARHHLNNSFANMLWMGQTVWGDHDMFHSGDPVAAEIMARSKAISGGPIYLSDSPANIVPHLVHSLCFSDGRLLQPLAPAAPLPESVFIDSYQSSQAYRVIAPLSHGCAMIIGYNLTHPEKSAHGKLAADDYRWAGALMQDGRPEWTMPAEGLIAFDPQTKTVDELTASPLSFTLPRFGDWPRLLCPIVDGVAVIGLENKFLSPQGLTSLRRTFRHLSFSLYQAGPVLLWTQNPHATLRSSVPTAALGAGLWRLEIPESSDAVEITVSF